MDRVRWGVLGTASIGVHKVIPAMQRADHVEVRAIASRDGSRAAAVAAELGIHHSHASYEALLADPEIDAVYIPLPNHLHVPWSIRALEAGKHVLCEKPIGLSVAEAEELKAAAARHPKLKVMEAFMYRHHPQWVRAKELVTAGEIGVIKNIQTFFSYFNDDPGDIRNQSDIGGGGLMDIGCYPISVSRFIFDAEPLGVDATIEFDATFGTDTYGSATLAFAGATSTFTWSTQLAPYQRVNIVGTKGRIEIMIPFNAPPDEPCVIHLQRGATVEVVSFPITDQYTVQGEAMSLAILNDTPVPTPIGDAVANMRVIERCFAAARGEAN